MYNISGFRRLLSAFVGAFLTHSSIYAMFWMTGYVPPQKKNSFDPFNFEGELSIFLKWSALIGNQQKKNLAGTYGMHKLYKTMGELTQHPVSERFLISHLGSSAKRGKPVRGGKISESISVSYNCSNSFRNLFFFPR